MQAQSLLDSSVDSNNADSGEGGSPFSNLHPHHITLSVASGSQHALLQHHHHHFGQWINSESQRSEVLHVLEQQLSLKGNSNLQSQQKPDTLKVLEDQFGEKVDYCRCLVDIYCSTTSSKLASCSASPIIGGSGNLQNETAQNKTQQLEVRIFAGQTLKQLVEKNYQRMSEREVESFDQIKEKLTKVFFDQDSTIRKIASAIMAKMLTIGGYYSWSELIDFLLKNLCHAERIAQEFDDDRLANPGTPIALSEIDESISLDEKDNYDQNLAENALEAIAAFVEKFAKPQLEDETYYHQIAKIVPHIFRLLHLKQIDSILQYALNILNILLQTQSQVLSEKIDGYLHFLLQKKLHQDHSLQVKWRAVQSITNIMEQRLDIILSNFSEVSDVMINALKEKDQKVALAATEFWSGIVQVACRDPKMEEVVVQKVFEKLPELCRLLLECCQFTDYDRQMLPSNTQTEDQQTQQEEEDLESLVFLTTLRRSSAFTLERFSKIYHDEVFYVLHSHLETALKSQQIDLMEPAILVLGAISDPDGAYCVIQIHLPNSVPYLMDVLSNNNEIIRSTTLWTLSKFTEWISQNQSLLEEYLTMLCQRMMDNDVNVQEAACSAFTVMVESVRQEQLIPLIHQPLNAFDIIIDIYKGITLCALLDSIGQIAVKLKEYIRSNEHMRSQILSILVKKWYAVFENEEQELKEKQIIISLLECFELVVSAFGIHIESFSMPIFKQCYRILQRFISLVRQDEDLIKSESALFQRSIDLVSALCNALGQRAQQLLINQASPQSSAILSGQPISPPNTNEFISTLLDLLTFKDYIVRQYVFGLLGDMQKHQLSDVFKLQLPQLILTAIDNMVYIIDEQQSLQICNNACWFLGEVAVVANYREIIKPFLTPIAVKLMKFYQSPRLNSSLAGNVAITFGRLGLVDAKEMAINFLEKMTKQWCITMRAFKSGFEKETSYVGFIQMIQHNPAPVLKFFPHICSAFVQYKEDGASEQLIAMLRAVLLSYKQIITESQQCTWEEYIQDFPPDIKFNLNNKFNL